MKRMRVVAQHNGQEERDLFVQLLERFPKSEGMPFAYETAPESRYGHPDRWTPAEGDVAAIDVTFEVNYDEVNELTTVAINHEGDEIAEVGIGYIAPGELEIDDPKWDIIINSRFASDEQSFPHTLSPEQAATEIIEYIIDDYLEKLGQAFGEWESSEWDG